MADKDDGAATPATQPDPQIHVSDATKARFWDEVFSGWNSTQSNISRSPNGQHRRWAKTLSSPLQSDQSLLRRSTVLCSLNVVILSKINRPDLLILLCQLPTCGWRAAYGDRPSLTLPPVTTRLLRPILGVEVLFRGHEVYCRGRQLDSRCSVSFHRKMALAPSSDGNRGSAAALLFPQEEAKRITPMECSRLPPDPATWFARPRTVVPPNTFESFEDAANTPCFAAASNAYFMFDEVLGLRNGPLRAIFINNPSCPGLKRCDRFGRLARLVEDDPIRMALHPPTPATRLNQHHFSRHDGQLDTSSIESNVFNDDCPVE
ncbi:hypothetical protein JX265_002765 [Neoarthrinium moseri]|uniref:Uncharacterized protein n=1 Tax=Neoarthrinium moseri TaxID=1658444 RepID=A0A9Q0APM0_9PEZI|nr:hypothetical protein JX265_002765 [Neoarthrinium moseri]